MSRRPITGLVVVALGGIGVAAAVDALVRDGEGAGPTATNSAENDAVKALRTAGINGDLTYADERCRLHALTLPTRHLEAEAAAFASRRKAKSSSARRCRPRSAGS
ncbi:MAG: hypothetical protein ACRDON_05525 [Gaiellaceae bacterium]